MRAWVPVLLLLGAACRPPATGPVRLAPGAVFTLRTPEAGPAFFESQEVEVLRPDGTLDTFLATVENGGGRLVLVAASPLGMTLFTVVLTGDGAKVEARVPLPRPFDPRLLPALIQLARWPLEDLRRGLGPGLELREEGPRRTLLRGGAPFVTLDRPGEGRIHLVLPTLGVTVDIRTLEDQP